jgi:hypothetical protein
MPPILMKPKKGGVLVPFALFVKKGLENTSF